MTHMWLDQSLSGFRLEQILSGFAGKRVLVVGDLMLDHYLLGHANRISPEAPVPVIGIESETFRPGGAGNVIHNFHELGVEVAAMGVVGADADAEKLKECLVAEQVDLSGIVTDPERPTTTKIRVVAHSRHHQAQQIVRVDRETTRPVSGLILLSLVEHLRGVKGIDAIFVSDYAKGVVTFEIMDAVREIVQRGRCLVGGVFGIVDPKGRNFEKYYDVTAISPNQSEALGVFNLDRDDEETVVDAGHRIVKDFNIPNVFMTRSEKGVSLFRPEGKETHIPATAREVFDVSGAGDTTAAVYTLSILAGAHPPEAAYMGNLAGGIAVGKAGVATVSRREILKAHARE